MTNPWLQIDIWFDGSGDIRFRVRYVLDHIFVDCIAVFTFVGNTQTFIFFFPDFAFVEKSVEFLLSIQYKKWQFVSACPEGLEWPQLKILKPYLL